MTLWGSITNALASISGNTWWGEVGIAAGALATAYFTPIVGLLVACFACTTVDMIYGIKVAKKLGKKITSGKNWKGTLRKIRDEFIMIMLGHMIEYALLGADSVTLLSGGTATIICITELWSILENLNTLDPDGPWRMLGKYLRKKGQDYVGVEIDIDSDGKICDVNMVKESQKDHC